MNKRWNKEEEKKLIELFIKQPNYELIADRLNRSSSATKLRMESIVYDNLIGGKKIDDIALKLNKTPDQIAEMYYIHKNFKKGKGEMVQDIALFRQIERIVGANLQKDQKGGASGLGGSGLGGSGLGGSGLGGTPDPPVIHNNISKLEKENHMMKMIIENYQMKKNIAKLYRAGKIDKSVIHRLKHIGV